MVQFKTWIWGLFPEYFNANDSYKNSDGRGLLERYLENLGQELDDEFIPFVENLLNLIDATQCDEKYLKYLSYTLGSPITIDNDNATYRKIIRYAVL